ncbi:MAG: hypothetical protein FD180_3762 [Planctomycetota bacterium]|nr:MAG: hypothetical protein FD180_3762 [Planctomycetota bacterium]
MSKDYEQRRLAAPDAPFPQAFWGVNQAIAVIKMSCEAAELRWGVTFDTFLDDLGKADLVLIEPGEGSRFILISHRQCPRPGIDIWIHKNHRNLADQLMSVLAILKLDRQELSWTHPEIA